MSTDQRSAAWQPRNLTRQEQCDARLEYYRSMVSAAEAMAPDERAEFDEWDQDRPGNVGTSDWPGWLPLIGPPPWSQWKDRDRSPARKTSRRDSFGAPREGLYLYRLWTEDDRLLYVGISRCLNNRLATHRRKWGVLVHHATWEEQPDVPTMLAAERHAIADEHPALNIAEVGWRE